MDRERGAALLIHVASRDLQPLKKLVGDDCRSEVLPRGLFCLCSWNSAICSVNICSSVTNRLPAFSANSFNVGCSSSYWNVVCRCEETQCRSEFRYMGHLGQPVIFLIQRRMFVGRHLSADSFWNIFSRAQFGCAVYHRRTGDFSEATVVAEVAASTNSSTMILISMSNA